VFFCYGFNSIDISGHPRFLSNERYIIIYWSFAFFDFFFIGIFKGEGAVIAQVSGPVGIVGLVQSATSSGFPFVLQLIALLSINLAIINFIPFPALDGGRLLFLGIELVRKKPISEKTSNIANNIGFAILILLMLVVTYKDILKLIR